MREEEESRMQRLQDSVQMSEWLSKEGDFQLEQEKKRAAIRIKEKRAKAIDFLALNLKYVNPPAAKEDEAEEDEATGLEIDLDEPYKIFDVCPSFLTHYKSFSDSPNRTLLLNRPMNFMRTSKIILPSKRIQHTLISGLSVNLTFSETRNSSFFQHMMVVCKDHLERVKDSDRIGFEGTAAVESEVTALLAGKSYDDLASLQRRIQDKLTSGEPIDTDYWENLLKKLLVWKAKVNCSRNPASSTILIHS